MNDRTKTPVRRHPQSLIDRLLAWCEENAVLWPQAVTAIGLCYGYGLNEHQIAAARFVAISPVAIEFPLARRASEIRDAEPRRLILDQPVWLAAAVHAALGREAALPQPVLRARSRVASVRPDHVRTLVAEAAAEATGMRMSCATLVSTRTANLAAAGLPFGLFDLGWAPSYLARLLDPRPVIIAPRKVA